MENTAEEEEDEKENAEREQFQKHMKRKTSYFGFSAEGSQEDIELGGNCDKIYDEWSVQHTKGERSSAHPRL